MGKDSKDYSHNKGQQDAARGKYHEPHGALDDLTTWSESGVERNAEDNEAYRKGYYHGKGQQDAAKGQYEPPHGVLDDLTTWSDSGMKRNAEENKAYDAGYQSTSDQKKSGGCFISTACFTAAALPDNCRELETLRRFRDEYVRRLPNGEAMIRQYYNVAPPIVAAIESSPNRRAIWQAVFEDLRRILALIELRRHEAAVDTYCKLLHRLQAAHL